MALISTSGPIVNSVVDKLPSGSQQPPGPMKTNHQEGKFQANSSLISLYLIIRVCDAFSGSDYCLLLVNNKKNSKILCKMGTPRTSLTISS